ncbi:MAG: hypothetical protein ACR2PG_06340 [Hyphomicrobiaceae bacterium]
MIKPEGSMPLFMLAARGGNMATNCKISGYAPLLDFTGTFPKQGA